MQRRDLDGEAVILDLGSGTYFGLNQVGTRVWQLISDGSDEAHIVDVVNVDLAGLGAQALVTHAVAKLLEGQTLGRSSAAVHLGDQAWLEIADAQVAA